MFTGTFTGRGNGTTEPAPIPELITSWKYDALLPVFFGSELSGPAVLDTVSIH